MPFQGPRLVIYSFIDYDWFTRPFDWFYDRFIPVFTEFGTRWTHVSLSLVPVGPMFY